MVTSSSNGSGSAARQYAWRRRPEPGMTAWHLETEDGSQLAWVYCTRDNQVYWRVWMAGGSATGYLPSLAEAMDHCANLVLYHDIAGDRD